MWGYRLVREADFAARERLIDDLHATIAAKNVELIRRADALGLQLAEARSKSTMADLQAVELTLLRDEVARFRYRATGIPQKTASIVAGEPMRHETLGSGSDLWSDVGDERAEALGKAGLLHETAPDAELTDDGLAGLSSDLIS